MKNRYLEEYKPDPLGISAGEILLIILFALLVWLIPVDWLNTSIGKIAFIIPSRINPLLYDVSISLAKNKEYFIHCHVIAFWTLVPWLPFFILGRQKNIALYADYFKRRSLLFGGRFFYLIALYGFFIGLPYLIANEKLFSGGFSLHEDAESVFAAMLGITQAVVFMITFLILYPFSIKTGLKNKL